MKFGATNKQHLTSQMIKYCQNDVDILMQAIMKLRHIVQDISNVDPIETSFTIASIGMEIFRTKYIKNKQIGIIPVNG